MNLKICVGTTCYLMGGTTLIDGIKELAPDILKHMKIDYATCFGVCQGQLTPPVVMVDGELIGSMTSDKLKKIIIDKMGE